MTEFTYTISVPDESVEFIRAGDKHDKTHSLQEVGEAIGEVIHVYGFQNDPKVSVRLHDV